MKNGAKSVRNVGEKKVQNMTNTLAKEVEQNLTKLTKK